MSLNRLRSFITLFWLASYSLAIPVANEDDEDDDQGCWSEPEPTLVHVPNSPSAAILAPYELPPTPHPSPSQQPHATLPVSHRSHTPAVLGTVFSITIAFVVLAFTARFIIHRRRLGTDPFKDPPKPRFTPFRFRPGSSTSKKRLSDESWVSPALPCFVSPGLPLSHDLELRRYAYPQRKLVAVTTPVCTPTEAEFGARLGDIPVPRVPSPVYFSPFSPSPSLSSSPSSLSPAPSTEPLHSSSSNPARLSRLLSSTFRDTRVIDSPARPTTAHLIQTARSYANAYRPSSTTSTSLYTPPSPSVRVTGTRSRTSFYSTQTDDTPAWESVRNTFSTVTTIDTINAVPHLLRAVAEHQPSTSPFADPIDEPVTAGTPLGLKVRLSDASEHAHYRFRERERERKRKREKEQTSREFKLRDSESVLREIGW